MAVQTGKKHPKRETDERYFREIVDPVMRPLMCLLQKEKPSKTNLALFIIDYMKDIEINNQIEETKIANSSEIEMDSKSSEAIVDLKSLLLPPSFQPLSSLEFVGDHFSVSYSRRALEGWVKQPSPCCAAASAGGAWNAAMGFSRTDSRAQSHLTMIPLFSQLLQSQADTIKNRYERLLGAPLEPLLMLVMERLAEENRSLGGKNEAAASRKHVFKLVRLIVLEVVEARNKEKDANQSANALSSEDDDLKSFMNGDVFDRLGELFEQERAKSDAQLSSDEIEEEGEGDEEEGEGEEGEGEGNRIDSVDSVGSEDEVLDKAKTSKKSVKAKTVKKKKKKKSSKSSWQWKKELLDWFHKVGGLEKINAAKASTAPFGNWGVIGALRNLNDAQSDADVIGSLLMGKKSKIATTSSPSALAAKGIPCYIGLSRDDDERTVTAQWNSLRAAFHAPDSCLLFHLKNHYALIFAMREWEEPDDYTSESSQEMGVNKSIEENEAAEEEEVSGCVKEDGGGSGQRRVPVKRRHRMVRQVLTSRRGQRPSAWVDFSEARQTMLNWEGYKILAITRLN